MDVQQQVPSKIITWRVENAIMAPHLAVLLGQGWPYAPSQALIVVLPYAARSLLFYLTMAALTFLIAGMRVDLRQLALLGSLFASPFLILMAGGVIAPAAITPENWALYQVRMLPVLSLVPIALSVLLLRGLPRLPRLLVLILLVFFLSINPFVGLVPDDQKRKAFESMMQAGLIFYLFAFSLYLRVRERHSRQAGANTGQTL